MINKKISIIHIITSLESGGAQTTLLKLIRYTNTNINNLVIVLKNKNEFYNLSILEKDKILFLDINSFFSLVSGLINSLIFILKNKVLIIHSWLPHSDIFASILKIINPKLKIIWSIRYSELNRTNAKLSTLIIIDILKYLSYLLPSSIIFCSQRSLDFYKQKGFNKKKFTLIFNSVDPSFLNYNSNKISYNTLFTFGTLSRFHPIKDHETLIKSFSILPYEIKNKIQLLLAGKGLDKDNQKLNILIETYIPDIKVKLLGEIKNIKEYLANLNVFTLSSISEGFPNVLAEAMALGIPCISTDAGDSHYIIGKYGWVVPVKNSFEFSKAILDAYNLSTIQKDKLSINSKNRIKSNFSKEEFVISYLNLYKSLA